MLKPGQQERITNKKIDFIEDLFSKGFCHILEKIFLSLPLDSIISCKNVNSQWRKIVSHFHNSSARRIQQIIDRKISKSWIANTPTLMKSPEQCPIQYQDKIVSKLGSKIISDKRNVIVGGKFGNTRYECCINLFWHNSSKLDCFLD